MKCGSGMKSEKLFVIVRRDLTPAQQAVQAGHAVAEYLIFNPDIEWSNGTLVYLGVKNEEEIQKWLYRLSMADVLAVCFSEPDMNNELTAIATVHDESFFKKLQLL